MKLTQRKYFSKVKHLCIFSLISLIIILSGCISTCDEPKLPLDEVILRVSESQAEENVSAFIETYDFNTFLGLNTTDDRIRSDYDDDRAEARFIQNISLILANSRNYYNSREGLLTGRLFYYIACQNVTSNNSTQFLDAIIDMTNYQNYSQQLDIGYASNIIAYLHVNSTLIIEEDTFDANPSFLEHIYLNKEFDWYWIALMVIKYEWTCCSSTNSPGCYEGNLHGEIIVLSPTLQPVGVMALYELHVA